ncbi:putative saccharopine reductase [Xylariales sp. AK1849]|nr:putative saccharopine reductase [Xylariales sp. AK1849]
MASHKRRTWPPAPGCHQLTAFLPQSTYHTTTACRTLESAKFLSQGAKNATPISPDVTDDNVLDSEVAKHDLVISLIPPTFHATIVESAIRQKKHVVTTSYASPAMESNQQCKDTRITAMNEICINHLYTGETIDEVHKASSKILSFSIYCGGLPAPEASVNPLGYKFSWSTRGVLLALRNAAKYWKDGKVVDIAGPELTSTAKPCYIYPGYAYPNRDSAQTVIRWTLRYRGLSSSSISCPSYGRKLLRRRCPAFIDSQSDLEDSLLSLATFTSDGEKQRILGTGLRWATPLNCLCATLEKKLQLEKGERDHAMLQPKFEIERKDGSREVETSTLVEYGDPKG